MSFSPNRGSESTLVTLTGWSLATTTGVHFVSGATGALCTLVSTGNNFITLYPPITPPSGIRSGNFQVFNKYGNATTTNYFTWINTPFLSGFVPGSGFSGSSTPIRISGSGIRDLTGLYFLVEGREYTGVLDAAINESNTWIRTGYIPFISGSLNAYTRLRVMSEGGSHSPSQLFYIREQGLTLSGFADFPTPFQPLNYLRENAAGTSLEWRTPTDVLLDISGVNVYGDTISGNITITGADLTITGGKLNTTGINLTNSGVGSGNMIFDTILSGGYIIYRAKIGGVMWIGSSLAYS